MTEVWRLAVSSEFASRLHFKWFNKISFPNALGPPSIAALNYA